MSKLDIFLLDNLNSTKEELKTIKPKTYIDLIIQLRQGIKNLPQNYETFILDKDKKNILFLYEQIIQCNNMYEISNIFVMF